LAEKTNDDIFEHELVPKHILLSEEEAREVLERYRVKAHQLPHILSSDPAIKAINAKPDSIVKIVRKSSTAGESVVYRYVVRG